MENWQEQNNVLKKDFKFTGFNQAIEFVNQVAKLANEADHHPDILIHGYSNVEIRLTTHSQGSKITQKDYALAKKIDTLPKN